MFTFMLSNYSIENMRYDGVSLDVSAQIANYGYFLVPTADGTKFWTNDLYYNVIYQYELTTGWDLSTASYGGNSYTVAQDTRVYGMFMKADGTKMYALTFPNYRVYQYTLSTPYDITSASYDSKSYYFGTEVGGVAGAVFFKTDGTKMYVLGAVGSYYVYQYTLSSAWDVSTASYDSIRLDLLAILGGTSVIDIQITDDGEILRTTKQGAYDAIYELRLGSAWDVSSAILEHKTPDLQNSPRGFWVAPDAYTNTFLLNGGTVKILQYTSK